MKIRRKRPLSLTDPLRHPNHRRPVTRREFLGQGFTSSSTVSFNGMPATASVKSRTYLTATVPSGATTGYVTITTAKGTVQTSKLFRVIP